MFNTIIVDDEETIREGLSKYIGRSFPELNIIGVFSDGKDAIEFLESNHSDVVLTDIKMSEKSGIDVAQFIFENSPDTKVVFLSAYQEFEYAKQAIKYGVKNYLSKPIKLSELNESVNKLIDELRTERENIEKDSEDLQTLLSIVKRDFYSDILLGILKTPEEIALRADKIRLGKEFLENTQCSVFSLTILPGEDCYYSGDELHNCLLNLLREITGLKDAILLTQSGQKSFYLGEFSGFSNCEELFESVCKDLGAITENALELLSLNANYNVLFSGKNIYSLLDYHNGESGAFSDSTLIEDKMKSLLSAILSHDYQSATEVLNDLRIYSQSISISDSKNLMSKLFGKISNVIFDDLQFSQVSFDDADSESELFEKGKEALSCIFDKVSSSEDIENPTIAKAKKYIFDHISENIALEDIAGFVYLNPVYFSRFFKQHTGITLTDYLTKIRINLACDMLREHKYKIHEISDACGYKSSKYFAKIFKQYTGQTPSDYSKIN